jgi:hypothetical protein
MSAIRAFATRRAPFAIQRAAFSQSIARTAGKESALSTLPTFSAYRTATSQQHPVSITQT